jgi:hypothetical protein
MRSSTQNVTGWNSFATSAKGLKCRLNWSMQHPITN